MAMKTWKLVSGILSIILSVLVILQSCVAGFANTIAENGEASGTGGLVVAIILLAGGIVSIATKKGSKGGNIALIILFGLGSLVAFASAGTLYKDLYVWGGWCLLCGVLAIISLVKKKPQEGYSAYQKAETQMRQNVNYQNQNRYQNPNYQDPYAQDFRYQDPYQQNPYDPRRNDPATGYYQDPAYGNPYQQPPYQDPYAQPSNYQDPYAQYPYTQPPVQDPSPYDPYYDPRYDSQYDTNQRGASYPEDSDYDNYHPRRR